MIDIISYTGIQYAYFNINIYVNINKEMSEFITSQCAILMYM